VDRPVSVEVRRAADRAVTRTGWLDSRHSFSYGSHYDPANTHFGLLLACNEDVLAPGAGFDEHPHRDVEVVTWVLSGALAHTDSAGHQGEARPGMVQRMSAGDGVRHAERAAGGGPAHYVQMWLRPERPGGEPAYDLFDVSSALAAGRIVTVVPLRQPDATLHAARLPTGTAAVLPAARYLHLLVAGGAVTLDIPAGPGVAALGTGDAVRLGGTGPVTVAVTTDAELLAWEMRAGLPVG
jgi:redox-sensitive bicupin YhaK (pirin superfamily)